MACYHPLKAFMQPNPDNLEKNQVFVRSGRVEALRFTDKGIKSIFDRADVRYGDLISFEYVPCRSCFGCREDVAKMWTDRLMLELPYHKIAWFVTLTYDDEHLPLVQDPDRYGVIHDEPTLRKKDFQDFMKRLRQIYRDPDLKAKFGEPHLMYYAAGEYGEQSRRPHYHAIIYDLMLDDLVLWKSRSGFNYYSSETLSKVWKNGFVSVAKVNRETAAYTARYVMKKAMGDDKWKYLFEGKEPEFQLMSKRPAIGRHYYDDKVAGKQDSFYVNKIHYLTGPDSKPISFNIPRYFDNLTEKENYSIIVSVKEKRKALGKARQMLLERQSSKPYLDLLASEEANKIASNINFRNSSRKGGLSYDEKKSDKKTQGSQDL